AVELVERSAAARLHERLRVLSVDELHREEPAAALSEELVELDEVRVRELCERSELLLEMVERAPVVPRQRLQRDDGVAFPVERFIDGAEAARAQTPPDLEPRGGRAEPLGAEVRAGVERRLASIRAARHAPQERLRRRLRSLRQRARPPASRSL